MAHAEKCPICEGKGKIPRLDGWNCHEDACHGCDGKGWVSVFDEIINIPSVLSIEPIMPPNSTGDNPFEWTTYTTPETTG